MQACKLNLPGTHPSLVVSSILFEPSSRSLALMHSDSSILLYPPSPFPSPSPVPSFRNPISIPPRCSSASFLRLEDRSGGARGDDGGRVLFLAVMPEKVGGLRTIIRAWVLRKADGVFVRAGLRLKRKDGEGPVAQNGDLGVAVDLAHGFSVRIAGSVNVFALHSLSEKKIWVMGARVGDVGAKDGGGEAAFVVDLVKCAVIDCVLPIYTMRVFMGHLILGEDNGVRVIPLKGLVKGKRKEVKNECCTDLRSDSCQGNCEKIDQAVVEVDGGDDSIQVDLGNNIKKGSFSKSDHVIGIEVHGNGGIHENGSNRKGEQCKLHSETNDFSKFENGGLCFGKFSRNGIIRQMDTSSVKLSFGSLVLHENGSQLKSNELVHRGHSNSVDGNEIEKPSSKRTIADTKDMSGQLPRRTFQGLGMPSVDVREMTHVKSEANKNMVQFQTIKLRQDSCGFGSFFAAFKNSNCKAVSIHSLSQRIFLVLDSAGIIHLLCLSRTTQGSSSGRASIALRNMCTTPLSCPVKVQMLGVIHDAPKTSTIWVADGFHSVYLMNLPDISVPADKIENAQWSDKSLHLSACQAIFSSEKIQEIVPFAGNSLFVLGQGLY
ncbi:hypothetical protein EJ110_NYTH28296 [Nymphaea thermarum]|nr:hypothetical protein EJ110_NYTH28296 [Nymphaea thermarum]